SAILTETTPRRINREQAPPAFAQVECYHLAARLGRNDRSRSKAAEIIVTMRQPVRIAPKVDIVQRSLPAASSLRKRAPYQGTKSLESDRPGGPLTTCRRATTAIP